MDTRVGRHRVHERQDIGGEVGDRVSVRGALRITESALIRREDMEIRRQEWQDPAVGEPRVGPTVQEDDRRAAALRGVVKLGTR